MSTSENQQLVWQKWIWLSSTTRSTISTVSLKMMRISNFMQWNIEIEIAKKKNGLLLWSGAIGRPFPIFITELLRKWNPKFTWKWCWWWLWVLYRIRLDVAHWEWNKKLRNCEKRREEKMKTKNTVFTWPNNSDCYVFWVCESMCVRVLIWNVNSIDSNCISFHAFVISLTPSFSIADCLLTGFAPTPAASRWGRER